MRVSLFELSPRGANLMNLSTEPVQLVLSLLYISSFDASFIFRCVYSWHGFQCMLLIWIYRYTCAYPRTPLGIHQTTRWEVSKSPESACPDPKAWSLWILSVADQRWQRKRGSLAERLRPYPFMPSCLALKFSFCISWAPFVLFILVYLFVFSQLRLSVM